MRGNQSAIDLWFVAQQDRSLFKNHPMTVKPLLIRFLTNLLITAALSLALPAQDLEPRAYSNSPTGLNFVIVGYGYAEGSVLTDPSLPLENVSNNTHVGIVAG